MKKILYILLFILLSGNLNAHECISFEGVKNKKVISSIIHELDLININSRINSSNQCKYKIYLPIKIYIEKDSKNRNIEIFLTVQKEEKEIEYKRIHIYDNNSEIYETLESKNLKNIIIKKHSKIIAANIKKEFF